jgi:hypothetical protein
MYDIQPGKDTSEQAHVGDPYNSITLTFRPPMALGSSGEQLSSDSLPAGIISASSLSIDAFESASSAFSGWSEGTVCTAVTTPCPGTPVPERSSSSSPSPKRPRPPGLQTQTVTRPPLPGLQTQTVTRPPKRKALLIGITYATRQAADAAAAAAAKLKRDRKSPVTPHQALTGPHVDCQAMKKILMGERGSGEPILSKADGMVAS